MAFLVNSKLNPGMYAAKIFGLRLHKDREEKSEELIEERTNLNSYWMHNSSLYRKNVSSSRLYLDCETLVIKMAELKLSE